MRRTRIASLTLALTLGGLGTALGDTTDGSCLESWELENFQPESQTFGQLVSSSSYHSRTTVILFLSAG